MNTEIKTILESVEKIFTAAQASIESLKDGERMQIKELAKSVGLAVAMEPKQVLGFVNYYVHNTSAAYVTRGKNGGIIRGSKPTKVVKPSKKVKKDTNTVSSDDSVTTV